jgi:hypothetical protein
MTNLFREEAYQMDCDKRFAIFNDADEAHYAAKIDGRFQVGKARDIVTESLAEFATAVLKDGKGGRFLTPAGQKSIMGVGGGSRRAVRYELDEAIAGQIGVAARG